MPLRFAARLTRPRLIILAAVLAIAGLLIAVAGQTGPAHAATGRAAQASAASWTTGPKPAIVLVHGAWADSGSWNSVIWRLQAAGYTVDAPPNPLRGVTYDSTYLADFLSTISGPIVLVGHSYGGFAITNAATGNPNIKALVYDDAYIPAQGDTLLGLTSAKPGSCLGGPGNPFNAVPYPGSPAGDVDLYVKASVFPGCFANGLPPARQRCSPLPSGRCRSAHSPSRPAPQPGRPSPPGTSSAPPTTCSRPPSNWPWPRTRAPASPRSTHPTCP